MQCVLRLSFVFLFLHHYSYCQNYTFQKLYGTSEYDGNCLVQCTDGSFLCAGSKYEGGDYDLFVIKTTSDGEILWSKIYSAFDTMLYPIQIVLCKNDEFAIAAIYDRNLQIDDRDFCLIRFDEGGNIEWSKLYGGEHFDDPRSLAYLPDNGFVGLGYTNSFGSSLDIFLFRVDSSGNYVWSNELGEANRDEWSSEVKVLTDGSIIVFGQSDIRSVEIAKFEYDGTLVWNKDFDFTHQIIPWSMDVSYDKSIYVVGVWEEDILPNVISPFLIKFDSSGNILWHKHYLSNDFNASESFVVKATRDMGAIINLDVQALIPNFINVGLLKVDKDGVTEWAKAYSIYQGSYPRDLITTNDGGYAVSGFSNAQAYFLKTDQDGNTGCSDSSLSFFTIDTATVSETTFGIISDGGNVKDVALTEMISLLDIDTLCENEIALNSTNDLDNNHKVILYPNPSEETLIVQSEDRIIDIAIISMVGQTIFSLASVFTSRIEIPLEHVPSGAYHLRAKTLNGYEILPFIKTN
ncbi:MAG TPA: T9SS type A sorting domain-containing protein [Chitinophagales bacterium]|nr:T9SS type A sorting domain-containing protein [Chitinophagales bacterium]